MSGPSFGEDFRDVLAALRAEQVEFLVVGAHAMAAHSVPRATGDLDLLVRPSPENAERVIRALTRFGAPLRTHGIAAADFAQPGTVYQLGLPPNRIDVLTEVSGVSFEEAWRDRLTGVVDGEPVAFMGLETLKRNKRATGRDKDLADVKLLEGIKPG